MKAILAIDPGTRGGLAWIDAAECVTCHPMPDTEGELLAYIHDVVTTAGGAGSLTAYVEQVSGFAGDEHPGSAMFKFGRGYGFALGVLMALRVRVELVTPQRWQKGVASGTQSGLDKAEWKRKLKAQAERLFPGQRVTLKTGDALLLLEYARRFERGSVAP